MSEETDADDTWSQCTDILWESRLACRKLLSHAKKSRFPDAEEFIAKLIYDAADERMDADCERCDEEYLQGWGGLVPLDLVPMIYRTLAGSPGEMDAIVLDNYFVEHAPYGSVLRTVGEQLIRLATRKGYMSAERTGKST